MKKLSLVLALLLCPTIAWAQCNGVFTPGQVCGNSTAAPAPAQASSLTSVLNKGPIIVAVRSSSASTVTASATTDYFLCLDPTSNAITVNLPATPTTGLSYLIKDCTGQASSHNITISPASGNIDGSSSYVMSTAYISVAVTYTGSQWSLN